jgi:hypothetical protein
MPSLRLFLATILVLSCDVAPSPKWRVYRVGDETLSHVALKTGVSVARLRALNHLRGDAIGWGTGLLVPEGEKTLALPVWRPSLPAPDWKACPQVEWVKPVSVLPDARCRRQLCAGEACLCQPLEDEPGAELIFGLASLKVELFPLTDPGVLRHARVDLDGDGTPESVVSVREGVSNGLGVEWWRHLVLQGGQPIASFVTIDYGDSFVAQARGCALLAVMDEWRTDQLRGEGSYWVARLHVLKDGALRAVGPEVARRYTHRFAAQRWAGLEGEPAQPLPWFTDVGAFTWPEADQHLSCREGSVVFEDDEGRFDLGGLGLFERRDVGREEPLDSGHFEYDRVLDGVTGVPLLEEYRPFGEARWSGRKVRVCEGVAEGEPLSTISLE